MPKHYYAKGNFMLPSPHIWACHGAQWGQLLLSLQPGDAPLARTVRYTDRKIPPWPKFVLCVPSTGLCRVSELTLQELILNVWLEIAEKFRERMTERFWIRNKLKIHHCQWLPLTILTIHVNQETRREKKKGIKGGLNKPKGKTQGENLTEYKSQLKHSWCVAFNCF